MNNLYNVCVYVCAYVYCTIVIAAFFKAAQMLALCTIYILESLLGGIASTVARQSCIFFFTYLNLQNNGRNGTGVTHV